MGKWTPFDLDALRLPCEPGCGCVSCCAADTIEELQTELALLLDKHEPSWEWYQKRCQWYQGHLDELHAQMTEIQTARDNARSENIMLAIALRKLMKESAAIMAISGDAIKDSAGYTNWKCLETKISETGELLDAIAHSRTGADNERS